MNRKQFITLACYAAFIAIGVCVTIFGPAKDILTQRFGLPLKDGGNFISLHYIGAVIGIVVTGSLLDKVNARYLLVGGTLLMGIGLLVLTQAQSLWLAYASMVVIGLGYGALDICPNLVVASLNTERASIALNILNIMWGIGAALGPQVANFALSQQNINIAFLLTGTFSLALAIPFAFASLEPRHRTQGTEDSTAIGAISMWSLIPFVLLIFVYVGAENGFGQWLFTEVTNVTRSTDSVATLATSLFWGGLTVGRVVASLLLRRISDETLLMGTTLLIAISAALLIVLPGVESIALISAFLVGIGCGPIFPTSLAILNRRFPRGTITGTVVAFGTTGGIVIPWVQGQVGADHSGGMIVTVILGFVLLALAWLVQRKPSTAAQYA
ncbi:MAG: MFS transporter [Anaerolineae bacterium]|nr:MFS transporter [Anaerolineae bacterium]